MNKEFMLKEDNLVEKLAKLEMLRTKYARLQEMDNIARLVGGMPSKKKSTTYNPEILENFDNTSIKRR